MKRNNLSKAVYDFAKVAFAGLVIAPLTTHSLSLELVWGFLAVLTLIGIAWMLDKEGEN